MADRAVRSFEKDPRQFNEKLRAACERMKVPIDKVIALLPDAIQKQVA